MAFVFDTEFRSLSLAATGSLHAGVGPTTVGGADDELLATVDALAHPSGCGAVAMHEGPAMCLERTSPKPPFVHTHVAQDHEH